MQDFSVNSAGFVALTITELMLQECVIKGVLSERDVKRILRAATRRHKAAAKSNPDSAALNTESAALTTALMAGLQPLFDREKEKKKPVRRRKTAVQKTVRAKS